MADERRPVRYILNVNDGMDTMHRDPIESCNLDDADRRQTVDAETADALLATDQVRRCRHCFSVDE